MPDSAQVNVKTDPLPIIAACDELLRSGSFKPNGGTARTLRRSRDTIEALVAAVDALLAAADHAGGLGGCDPELEAACSIGSAALAKAKAA